jgi:superfamily II DNA/RNA helicase
MSFSFTACQNSPEMLDAGGRLRKLIIFSEHRDTPNYLHDKIAGVLGSQDAIVVIHGGTDRDTRRERQARFWSDPDVRVLVATDAASEGVNLQCAHLMVNYDLPWNPNRPEQRFGRIHRINQTEVCHLWSLVAKETREGAVYHRLLEKLQVESKALQGRVFDILGEVFEETSLKELLIRAIKYGDQPEVRKRLTEKIDSALNPNPARRLVLRAGRAVAILHRCFAPPTKPICRPPGPAVGAGSSSLWRPPRSAWACGAAHGCTSASPSGQTPWPRRKPTPGRPCRLSTGASSATRPTPTSSSR